MERKRNILKEAGILLIAAAMIFSAFAVTAKTTNENALYLTSNPAQNIQIQGLNTRVDVLWDQYDTDGSNGLSHAPQSAFGFERALLDDFEVPVGEIWTLTELYSLNLWNTMPIGSGTDFVLEFWSDNAGSPGSVITAATTVSYTETATGRTWFSRPEFEIEYIFEDITLNEGTYWIWGHVDGPENCFWMARETIWGSEAWVDYEDYPPAQPGSNVFGSPYDLAFQLLGDTEVPEPPEPYLECEGSLSWTDVEGGTTVTGTFMVKNVGEPDSLLNWEITSWPDWGTWSFTPSDGTGLLAGDSVNVTATCVAPELKLNLLKLLRTRGDEYTGTIVVTNTDNTSNTDTVSVFLSTPINQGIPGNQQYQNNLLFRAARLFINARLLQNI